MTQSPPFPLLKHPAFKELSSAAASRLEDGARVLRFELGQQLVEPDEIPARILILLKGQARLVGRHNGRLTTVGKFGPGSVIGAASLMVGKPCENVVASQDLVACAIADELWSDLYASEQDFRSWCDRQLWPQELLQLLEVLTESSASAEGTALELLEPSLKSCQRCAPEAAAIEAARAEGLILYLSSNWGSSVIGQPVDAASGLDFGSRFAPRLVAVPADIQTRLDQPPSSQTETETENGTASEEPAGPLVPFEAKSEDAEVLPPVSRYSPERNVVDSLRLIRASGPLQETLACFQMLAQLMKLPFRRDSIEKVLQDNLRRGLTPNLQLCGQLAASLGLHVMAARVPAAAGTRLQVPSMVPWQGGFALVVASHERGLKLASPKHGMVTLNPDDLEESFPEGIELLLMERSNATPDQKFGPSWFWPALKRYRGVLIQVLAASFVVQLFTLANPC